MASGDPFGQGMQQRNGSGSELVVEEYQVPDKMVGLLIGCGGEQIIRLQTETGCKIQLASEAGGASERPCTLTGSRESVQAVKEMIGQIISKANSPFPPDPGHIPDGQYVAEMMIPGPKVGLLIGKGGENIRNLQEKGGVKMVLIQEGPQQTSHEKPLRISGDPQKVERGDGGYSNGGGPPSQDEMRCVSTLKNTTGEWSNQSVSSSIDYSTDELLSQKDNTIKELISSVQDLHFQLNDTLKANANLETTLRTNHHNKYIQLVDIYLAGKKEEEHERHIEAIEKEHQKEMQHLKTMHAAEMKRLRAADSEDEYITCSDGSTVLDESGVLEMSSSEPTESNLEMKNDDVIEVYQEQKGG